MADHLDQYSYSSLGRDSHYENGSLTNKELAKNQSETVIRNVVEEEYLNLFFRSGESHTIDEDPYYNTTGQCQKISLAIAKKLLEDHGEQFTHVFVLESWDPGDLQAIKRNIRFAGHHDFFVAVDREGNYFAGSPANIDKQSNPVKTALTPYFGQNLEDILTDIQNGAGWEWPSASQVRSKLKLAKIRTLFNFDKKIHIPLVGRSEGEAFLENRSFKTKQKGLQDRE